MSYIISSEINQQNEAHNEKSNSGIFVTKLDMKLTMVDRRVCQTLSEALSSITCYICQATPNEMNGKVIDIKSYDYGLSTLCASIHFMENLLHIAYRLDFKK